MQIAKTSLSTKTLRFFILGAYAIIGLWLFFWDVFFLFDLFSHFYFLYCTIGFFIVSFSIFSKDTISIISSLVLFSFLVFQISKADVFVKEYHWEADIFYLNSHFFVDQPDLILSEIKKRKAKYVMIVELNESLHQKLKSEYKNFVYHPNRALSLWFYTNEAIFDSTLHELSYPVLEFQTEMFSGLLIHPLPPFNTRLSKKQQANFAEIQELFQNIEAPKKMIIWDFNSTFFSKVFKEHFGEYHYQPIYSRWGSWPLRMPIDYALGNSHFFDTHSTNFTVSDHLPLLLDLRDE